MKVYEIQDDFGIENLQLTDRDEPDPGPGQVLLDMKATSLNFRDLMTVQGTYNPHQPLPLIPFSDGVGVVEQVGEGVDRVEPGERVAPIFAQGWVEGPFDNRKRATTLGGPLDGTLAEKMVLDARGVVAVPEYLSHEEVASLPCAGVTAWNCLTKFQRVRSGDTVLLQGTGGVSIFALQFAKMAGARVIITSSSDEKLERTRELGADETINYVDTPDWDDAVLELTDGTGVDLVVEVGGAGTLQKSLNAVRIGGQLSMIGVLSGGVGDLNIANIVMKAVRAQGIVVGSRIDFEAMNEALEETRTNPVVDRTFDFDEVPEALRFMQEGKHFGKIAVRYPE